MTKAAKLLSGWIFVIALVALPLLQPKAAVAQAAGDNAVYNSSGNCSPPNCGYSPAFIDARCSKKVIWAFAAFRMASQKKPQRLWQN